MRRSDYNLLNAAIRKARKPVPLMPRAVLPLEIAAAVGEIAASKPMRSEEQQRMDIEIAAIKRIQAERASEQATRRILDNQSAPKEQSKQEKELS